MSLPDTIAVLISTRRGGSGGRTFSDALLLGDIATAGIKQITIWHEDIVYGLKVIHALVVFLPTSIDWQFL